MSENVRKSKYLFKNIGILTIAQFGSKFLTILLVPLYTNLLTTQEYGIYELAGTTISLLIPIVTLNIVESTVRFSLDKEYNKKDVFSISIKYLLIGVLFTEIALIINLFTHIVLIDAKLTAILFIMFIAQSFASVLSGFARGMEKISDVAISGVISVLITIVANILFLLKFRWGLIGYFCANCLGPLVQCVFLWTRLNCHKYVSFQLTDTNLEMKMRMYSVPMIANVVAWWINSASDRYLVTFFCGVAINGVYSIGYKIPSILAVFTNMFNSAWTLSAVKDYDPDDSDGFFSKMYSLYNFLATIICSILIIFSRLMASLLFAKEFYNGWIYIPCLLIANLFSALTGYLGGVFSAVKDTKMFAKSTVIGAAVNIIFNVVLIYFIGALGAAIATLLSYIVIWFIRYRGVLKYIEMRFKIVRDMMAYLFLIIQGVLLFVFSRNNMQFFICEFVIVILIGIMFKEETSLVFSMFKNITNRNNSH